MSRPGVRNAAARGWRPVAAVPTLRRPAPKPSSIPAAPAGGPHGFRSCRRPAPPLRAFVPALRSHHAVSRPRGRGYVAKVHHRIAITPMEPGEYGVEVTEGDVTTGHRVRVPGTLV